MHLVWRPFWVSPSRRLPTRRRPASNSHKQPRTAEHNPAAMPGLRAAAARKALARAATKALASEAAIAHKRPAARPARERQEAGAMVKACALVRRDIDTCWPLPTFAEGGRIY